MVLAEVKPGGSYHVARVSGSGDVRLHLEQLGIVPGERVKVVSRIGSHAMIVTVKGCRIALDGRLASSVVV